MVKVRQRLKIVQSARLAVTYRQRVQAVIDSSHACLTGHAVADLAGLNYRQTIDALNALLNQGRVARTGRKFTARWCPFTPAPDPSAALQAAIFRIAKGPK